jgi:glycosyltransferase involved in cell wall biosynthesis
MKPTMYSSSSIPDSFAAVAVPQKVSVVHFTSGHLMPDVRIFHKECRTLVEAGYRVTVVVRHPKDEVLNGVRIVAIKSDNYRSRLERLTKIISNVYRATARERAAIYHFHDPELILAGLLLKLRGRKVIYDAHESFSRKLMSKPWIPRVLRPLVANCYKWLERLICRAFDHVIAADRTTAADFPGSRVTVVANYPIITEIQRRAIHQKTTPNRFVLVYAGGLERDRGVQVMLDVAELLGDGIELRLLGRWFDPAEEERASRMGNVTYLGFRPLNELYQEMMNADLGLVLLQPVPAYLYASENTNKIFEYMSCALPVVASDFPAFKTLLTQAQCGVWVDPANPAAIVEAIEHLLGDRELRERMGRNGRNAVLHNYNWDAERGKLLAVYQGLVGVSAGR